MQFSLREMMFTSLLVGLVAGTHAVVVQPHARARQQRLAEMRSMDAAIIAVHNSTKGLEGIAHHVDQQQQAMASFRSRLPLDADFEKAVDEVIQTAAANSLQSGEVRMQNRQDLDGVAVRPVQLQFSGNFNGFYSFLLQLEAMPRVTRITQMNLSGSPDRDGQIQVELTLMIYVDSGVNNPAKPVDRPSALPAQQIVTSYLSGDRQNLGGLGDMLRNTDNVLQKCLASPELEQVSLANLRNDPFSAGGAIETPASEAAEVHKSDTDRAAMLQEIEKLQLQSIVSSGDRPACMIDNRLYREGEQIDTFTVERIGQSEVVVRNGSYRFELKVAG